MVRTKSGMQPAVPVIRREQPDDAERISAVIEAAFRGMP
jgi:hypothetical protein